MNNASFNANSNHLNPDFYHAQTRFPSHLMIHHPSLPPPAFATYPYYPSPNYLSKPMPLMAPTSPCSPTGAILSHSTLIFPPEMSQTPFFHNQTYPSPPSSTSPSVRTNHLAYQNGNKKKLSNDQTLVVNESSKTNQSNVIPPVISEQATPTGTKSR